MFFILFIRFILTVILLQKGQNQIFARKCNRYPSNTFAAKSPVDDNYAILISGNPNTYILGQSYNSK